MTRLLEGIVKKHLLWKDHLFSRRDFFAVLLPFSRKRCHLCREERSVGGPYCPTCARRQMSPLLGKSLLVALLLIATSGTAAAFNYQFDSSSYLFFSKDRNVNTANRFYFPLYQYLNMGLTELGHPSLSLHVSGWGRGDFTSRGGDRGDGDLLYGYFQWKDPDSPRRLVRVGRQFFFGGPSSLRTQYLDGLYFKSDIVKGYGVEILGGSPITSSIGGRGGDFVVQARNYLVFENQCEFGVGYLNGRDSMERSREDVGLDFWLAPIKELEFYGYGYYDILGHNFSDANLTATVHPAEKWKITGDVSHTVPSFLLPHTSLLAVFSTSSYQNVGVAATWFSTDRLTFDGDGRFYHYSDGGNLFRFGAEGSYLYGDDKQGRVSLAAHRLDQIESGIIELRAYTSYTFKNKLSTSLDLYGYLFDETIRNRDFSVTAIANVGYEIIKDLKVVGSAFFSENPLFSNDFRGMVKLMYRFGGSSSVF